MNLRSSICLSDLSGAVIQPTDTDEYICIPMNMAGLTKSKNGKVYLQFSQWETPNNQYGNSHMIKQDLPKEKYQLLSEEDRRRMPIIGNSKLLGVKQQASDNKYPTMNKPKPAPALRMGYEAPKPTPAPADGSGDLPF